MISFFAIDKTLVSYSSCTYLGRVSSLHLISFSFMYYSISYDISSIILYIIEYIILYIIEYIILYNISYNISYIILYVIRHIIVYIIVYLRYNKISKYNTNKQFAENECEVLPSKERCPFLVVAEMIEQPFTSTSEEIYTQGAVKI